MPFTAFISDLHLSSERPKIKRVFLDFLNDTASAADALYILGDLFEYWLGDDDLGDTFNGTVAQALRQLSEKVPLYLMHGNRDFLLARRFAEASGATLIPDPTRVELYGVPTLLMHGDLLCTDDTRYQSFRRIVRRPCVQQLLLLQPLAWRRAEIAGTRRVSEGEKRAKPMDIMDVTLAAVEQAFRTSGCTHLIHGHTHRPARHDHIVDGHACQRWVLADWYTRGQYLRVEAASCSAVDLVPAEQLS